MNRYILLVAIGAVLLLQPGINFGQITGDEIPGATRDLIIRNIQLKSAPGEASIRTDIYLRNGLITKIGDTILPQAGARELKGDSLFAYAAFISPLSYTGQPDEEDDVRRSAWRGAPGATPPEQAGITPHNQGYHHFNISQKDIEKLHRQGFGIIHSVPKGFVMSGKGCLMLLYPETSKDLLILKKETGLYAQFRNKMRLYPATPLATMSVWREIMVDTRNQYSYYQSWKLEPEGKTPPSLSDINRALFPVIDGNQPVFFNASENRQILRAARLSKELDFPLVLSNVSKLSTDLFHLLDGEIPIIFDLNLPEKPEDLMREEEKEPEKQRRSARDRRSDQSESSEEKELELPAGMTKEEYSRLTESRKKAYEKNMELPALIIEKNLLSGFSILDMDEKDILPNLRKLMNYGMKEDDLLAALTTLPARLFGLESKLGELRPGMQAHLVLFDKPFTEEKASVQYIIINGQLIDYKKEGQ
ncbi:MAG: hypothetical protein EA409_04400 [Saprospirales bacterium]|nr:MAG: hypothetical protein EA409_04400 [Saprospirales bacterium]